MTKILLLACLVATLAIAQTTTVTGTITDPAGDPLSGSCSIQAVGDFGAATGWRVIGAAMVVPFSAGAFSATLTPTDTATPAGQYYKVTCAVPAQTVAGRTIQKFSWGPRYWLVPTNTSAVDIGTVEITSSPPTPAWQILLSQLAPSGAQVGQVPVFNGVGYVPGNVSGSGTSTCLNTVPFSATPTFDFAICTQQVITLAGNVTPAIAHPQACEVAGGCTITFIQGTGAWTVTWAGNVLGGFQPGAASGKRNTQSFTSFDGNNLSAITPGVINQ